MPDPKTIKQFNAERTGSFEEFPGRADVIHQTWSTNEYRCDGCKTRFQFKVINRDDVTRPFYCPVCGRPAKDSNG